MHLQDLFDSVQQGIEARRFVNMASLDIDGAFDKVPHSALVRTLLEAPV